MCTFREFCLVSLLFWIAGTALADTPPCATPGQWFDPASARYIDDQTLIKRMAARPVVLLGEEHDQVEHHRWQLHTIAALHGRNPNMVLAFEAFPRQVQPALDRWTQGQTSRQRFLTESRWNEVWRYDADLYMPLFDFARMHRIPMRAMNIDPLLVARVGREGWSAVPKADRRGISDPAPASAPYVKRLRGVFDEHQKRRSDKPTLSDEAAFRRFVEAQQTWDRAMAQAMATVRQAGGNPLVVGIVGSGHLTYGDGIPSQLADLGIAGGGVLLPWDETRPCDELQTASGSPVADAVFGVANRPPPEKPWRPRLGVLIENADGGTRISLVVAGSVAEGAGLKKDDLVVSAAGTAIARTADLVAVIRRQAPGTWLPLIIHRGGKTINIVAKFSPQL